MIYKKNTKVIFSFILLLLLITQFTYAEESIKTDLINQIEKTGLITNDDKNIPILMYHHITNDSSKWNPAIISPEKFRSDMIHLKGLGYTSITFTDYLNSKENGEPLPKNPIFITFDDGYYSNYEYAFPTLKELDMKATFFIIGWSVGRDTFIDEDKKITPHFNWDQAKEMYDSGFIDIQSHSFDMHSPPGLSYGYKNKCGLGLAKIEGEDMMSYRNRLYDDTKKMNNLIEENIGNKVIAFAYPYGLSTSISEEIMTELGIKISLTTLPGISNIEELRNLKRINTPHNQSTAELMNEILSYQNQDFRLAIQ